MNQLALTLMLATAITIPMHALNGSGEDGTATITQGDGGIRVSIALQNNATVPEPTHIHVGTCSAINKAPEYPLKDIVDGHSESFVAGVSLDDLIASHYAINVHKSGNDLGTYVSCGDIRR
jgi:hypothetical protein